MPGTKMAQDMLLKGIHENSPEKIALAAQMGANLDKLLTDANDYMTSPLAVAGLLGHFDAMKALVENGADPNYMNESTETPLFVFAQKRKPEAARVMISLGGNAKTKNIEGHSPFFVAAIKDYPDVLDVLFESGLDPKTLDDRGKPLFLSAAKYGCARILPVMVEKYGIDVNTKDSEGKTAMSLAGTNSRFAGVDRDKAEKVAIECISTLINLGADVNIRDNKGRTPLMYIVRRWGIPVFELVRSAGADIHACDNDGRSVFMHSAWRHEKKAIEYARHFISLGEDINRRNNKGETILYDAIEYDGIELMKVFLDAGAKINVKNNDGITPLMKSVEMQRYQAMMSLMAAGADLNIVDAMGRKAIDFFIGAYNDKGLGYFASMLFMEGMVLEPESLYRMAEFMEKSKWAGEGYRTSFALMLAAVIYPEKNEAVNDMINKLSANAFEFLLSDSVNMDKYAPQALVRCIAVMSGISHNIRSLDIGEKQTKKLVSVLLESLSVYPKETVSFIKKWVGNDMDTWFANKVEGVEELIFRLVPYVKDIDTGRESQWIDVGDGITGF